MKDLTANTCNSKAALVKSPGTTLGFNNWETAVLASLFNSGLLAISIIDDTNHFIKVNKGFCKLFNYTEETLLGKPVTFLFPKLSRLHTTSLNFNYAAIRKAGYNSVLKYTGKDGDSKNIKISSEEINYNGQQMWLIIAADITGKKIAEDELTNSKARLVEAQALAKVGSWETDLYTLKVTWSEETYRIFEINPEDFQSSHPNFLDFVHPDDRAKVDKAFVESFSSQSLNTIEHRICTTSGKIKIVEERWRIFYNNDGKAVRAAGTCQDISERKIADQKIVESEFKYRSVIEQATDAVCIADANFNMIDVNPSGYQMLGYTKDEFLQLQLADFFFVEDMATNPFRFDQLQLGNVVYNERRFKRKDGTAVEVEISIKQQEDGRYVCFGRDITERKLVYKKLKESNERYNIISEATNDMVWDWDFETGIVYRNKEGWKKIFRTARNEHISELPGEWNRRIHPDDLDKINIVLAEINKSEKDFFEVECRVQRDDGTWAYIHDRGNIIRNDEGKAVRMLGATQDITYRKEAELKLAKSESRYRSLVQNGSDLTSILDEKGYYLYCSPTINRILGHESENMIGKNAFSFIHPDDVISIKANLQKDGVEACKNFIPFRFINAQGEWRWLESKVTNQCNNPEIKGYVFNSRDVTEKIIASEEIKKLSIIARETSNAVIITCPDGKIVWVNEAFTRITEFKSEEVLGKETGDFLYGADTNPGAVRYIRNQLKKLQAFECDIINYSKTGRRYWVRIQCQPQFDETGKLKNFFTIQTDISKGKEAAEILKLSEERYRYLFNNNPASIYIWDLEDFKILEVNDTAVESYGYTKKEFLGKTILDLRLPEDYDKLKALAVTARQDQKFKSVNTWKHINKQGEEMQMHIGSHRIEYKGRPVILSLATNITDRVLLRRMLEKEKLAKQKEITEAVISAQEQERQELGCELHDNINQVLAGSLLYLGLAKKELNQDNAYIKETATLINLAIDEIRKLSHSLVPPCIAESEFLDALKNIIKVTEKTTGIMICLQTFGFDESSVPDKMKLNIYRIIQEQFNNILKHANAEKIDVHLTQFDQKTILIISDDGKGFETSKKSTGVGLMNIKTRASLFNGEVTITSSPGNGCELKVVFNPGIA